jgi:hypothetical protein
MSHRPVTISFLTLTLAALTALPLAAQSRRFQPSIERVVKLRPSRPLTEMPPVFTRQGHRMIPLLSVPRQPNQAVTDPVVQSTVGLSLPISTPTSILGVGEGFKGPNGSYSVNVAPPDTNGAVGDTQYVQWVNLAFAVFDKSTGNPVYGPVAGRTLWQNSGLTACEQTNDGDIIAQYDKLANRWLMAQLSYSQAPPYYECIAISQTSDATGAYYRYALEWSNALPDYPKWGVWPDAYYFSANLFTPFFGSYLFVGAEACALDRGQMLQGLDATVQCYNLTGDASLLPGDFDGNSTSPPPSGSPDYFMSLASNSLNLYRFHVDFANSNNTSLTGPINIPVASFSEACNGGTCIPQPGTSQQLDTLADRLMYRLAYRRFSDHESLVVTHSVNPGGGGGGGNGHGHAPAAPGGNKGKPGGGGGTTAASAIRWYEIRNPGGTPVVYQQGTYAPDTNSRWMGSIAMDKVGDIAVGYSVSSGTVYPSVRFAGRVPDDTLGTLEAESSLFEGSGSQLPNLSRWGDYSGMSVDPVDGCTFWYTNEYLGNNGTFNWSTRIGSFKFTGCQ